MPKTSTSFRRGQSGNPGGRPKCEGEVRELARRFTSEAIGSLVEIATGAKFDPRARVAAATALLDRGYGKPPQNVRWTVLKGDISQAAAAEAYYEPMPLQGQMHEMLEHDSNGKHR